MVGTESYPSFEQCATFSYLEAFTYVSNLGRVVYWFILLNHVLFQQKRETHWIDKIIFISLSIFVNLAVIISNKIILLFLYYIYIFVMKEILLLYPFQIRLNGLSFYWIGRRFGPTIVGYLYMYVMQLYM